MHALQTWMDHYGYYVLAAGLLLEVLALPIPGEVLMSYAGLLVYQGKLGWLPAILAASAGGSLGMTASYWIGSKLGHPFFEKYGAKLHLGPERLNKTSQWFERYGNKVLIIAYFIPGVRHITGYFSGITRMPFRTYMLFAYTGAFLWTGTFISLGKILGPKWEEYHHTITKYLIVAGVTAAVGLSAIYIWRKYRARIRDFAVSSIDRGVKQLRGLGRLELLIAAAAGMFIGLFILMAGLIQDFLAGEFGDFDAVAAYIVQVLFDESWAARMQAFSSLATLPALAVLVVLSLVWIMVRGRDRRLEMFFLAFVLVGGEAWDEGLRQIFHRAGPTAVAGTFPSEQTLGTIIYLGFIAYLLVRHTTAAVIRIAAVLLVLAVCLLVGISRVYFGVQYPSDVVAGYVFGGVWLSLCVVLLETFRLIRQNKENFTVR